MIVKFSYNKILLNAARLLLLTGGLHAAAQRTPQAPYNPATVKVNFVRTWDAMAPLTDANTMMTRPLKDVKQATQYFDGLGRPIQTVLKQGSLETGGTATDMVSAVEYDEFGREQFKYLPFSSTATGGYTNTGDGTFKMNPFQQQAAFYDNANTANPIKGQGETYFYGQTKFEASPLNRPLEAYAAGNSWVGTAGQVNEADRRAVKMKYWINTLTDDVKIWGVLNLEVSIVDNGNGQQTVTYNFNSPSTILTAVTLKYRTQPSGSWINNTFGTTGPFSITIPIGNYDYAIDLHFNNGMPSQTVMANSGTKISNGYIVTGTFGAGTLYKTVNTDEHGKQIIEFKDKQGKILLKKVQLTALSDNGTGSGYSGWLNTYYIYDDLGNLRCVIQPIGVDMVIADNWILNTITLDEQCFQYQYDKRNRVIKKKTPGSDEVWVVYDLRDRVVLTQDANMRSSGQKKWLYTVYDNLNRVISTGLIDDPVNYNNHNYHLNLANTSTAYPNIGSYSSEELTRVFYNDYDWLSGYGNPLPNLYNNSYDTYFLPQSNTDWPYAQANLQSGQLNSIVTGSRIKVIGSGTYLYFVNFYDEKGRVIQVQSTNITGGLDVVTTQYSWAGQPLVIVQKQQKAGSVNPTELTVITKMLYDDLGRLLSTKKTLNSTVNGTTVNKPEVEIATLAYDKLGQLKNKGIGKTKDINGNYTASPIETLAYDYNIRGWMLGMNRDYAKDANSNNYFGFDLGYDKTNNGIIGNQAYNNAQYNGNIAGMVWKSKGDEEKRKYDFSYDAVNRLMKADFTQYTGGAFNQSAGVNFNMKMGDGVNPASAYDLNGNILQMQQWGLKITGSVQIDNLKYTYITGSNKLKSVTDFNNDATTLLGDFRTATSHPQTASKAALVPGSSQAQFDAITDYSYDVNGNMVLDNNKAISSIVYNHLNLPQTITVAGKGTISYTYDAAGGKLKKTVYEPTGENYYKTTETTYLGGAVYESKIIFYRVSPFTGWIPDEFNYTEKLQFIGHEEGRIRFKEAVPNGSAASYEYDYMLKDHLGNVRMVLTDEQKTDAYPVASLEASTLTSESLYYGALNDGRQIKPSGYPNDTYTTPNDYVQKLNGNGVKKGANIVLKVMAGDKFNLRANSWYKTFGASPQGPNPITDLGNALAGSVAGVSGGKVTATELINSGLSANAATTFLNSQVYNTSKPKAFVNWIFLDEQFKYYAGGTNQVGENEIFKTHILNGEPINKSGYLYIYVSNETPNIDVYFDNLQVTHIRGAMLEETHYYPFGLVMQGISSKALSFGSPENKRKYNGIEYENSFNINVGEAFFRTHDPQIGRWWQIDPKSEQLFDLSPFNAMNNNPILNIDPLGDIVKMRRDPDVSKKEFRRMKKQIRELRRNSETFNAIYKEFKSNKDIIYTYVARNHGKGGKVKSVENGFEIGIGIKTTEPEKGEHFTQLGLLAHESGHAWLKTHGLDAPDLKMPDMGLLLTNRSEYWNKMNQFNIDFVKNHNQNERNASHIENIILSQIMNSGKTKFSGLDLTSSYYLGLKTVSSIDKGILKIEISNEAETLNLLEPPRDRNYYLRSRFDLNSEFPVPEQ